MSYPIPEDYADLHYDLTHPDRHSTGTVFADVMVEAIERIARLEADRKALLEALEWAFPLAELSLEHHRIERLKCGHGDIGRERCLNGGTDLGLWDGEVEARDKARAAFEQARKP